MYWWKVLLVQNIFIIFYGTIGYCFTLPKCCGKHEKFFKDGKCKQLGSNLQKQQPNSTVLGKFDLIERRPNCDNNKLIHVESTFSNNKKNIDLDFTRNGYFKYGDIYYPSNEYCVNRISLSKTTILVSVMICEPACSDSNPCLYKCCPPDQVLQFINKRSKCIFSGNTYWAPIVYNEDGSIASQSGNPEKLVRFNVTLYRIISRQSFFVYPNKDVPYFEKTESRILKNGPVLKIGTKDVRLGDHHCIDGMLNPKQNTIDKIFSENEEDTTVILYLPATTNSETNESKKLVSNMYMTAFSVASFFMLMTIIVYICLWEKRKSVQWVTHLSYFISLFFMYIFLAGTFIHSANVFRKPNNEVMSTSCLIIGVLGHFFFLSTFGWMTMINIDIWSKFGKLISLIAPPKKKLKKYIWYTCFALGIPSIIVGIALVLDNLPSAIQENLIIPNYGRERCYIKTDAVFPYLYGPIGVLLTANVIIYIITVMAVIRIKNNSLNTKISFASKRSSKVIAGGGHSSETEQSLILFAKLFLLMGIPWVLEVVGWAYGSKFWIWTAIDISNILQSVLIFFMCVCKRDIFRELRLKYLYFNKLLIFLHINVGTIVLATHVQRPAGTPRNSDLSSTSTTSFQISRDTTDEEYSGESTRL